ncbi:uncharacterized protein LOC130362096 isoform X1 [Hyla sarda]|uniref:uncharacterized protein LOC130362096 isoform X1 n=1 Tax=Hyla sarda TaxID=327740 RepID=UPI0024C2E759|nr:uncharacterized protein LOC130362096 isoform X1 [Hyla sarda]XP_056422045.1 uncharacterized protein LOC130362096 isoform X1 [Hyla sarda]
MGCIIEYLAKKIGLSSNQLLKCVLLNTAIELFSYIDAPPYSSSGYLYQDWSMDDFDYFYNASPDTGQTVENADSWLPDRITDQAVPNQEPSMEDTACIATLNELETMYLPIPEHLCGTSDSNSIKKWGKAESFYYLVGPDNLWLEFPLTMDMQAPPCAATWSTQDYLTFCGGKELSFLNTSPGVSRETKRQESNLNTCAVQTTEDLLHTVDNSERDFLYSLLHHEAEAKESIIWDSYDLHLSRSPMECAHTKSWETKEQDFPNIEDLFTLVVTSAIRKIVGEKFVHAQPPSPAIFGCNNWSYNGLQRNRIQVNGILLYQLTPEEELVLLAQEDVEALLGADFYPLCDVAEDTYSPKHTTKLLGEHPVSSTPYVQKTRASIQRGGVAAPDDVPDSFLPSVLFANDSS